MTLAAYDAFADWYEQWATWPSGMLQYARHLLPRRLDGARVVDAACGHGRLSRELAALGAEVTGVDLSGELVRKASADSEAPLVTYRHADFSRLDDWWDGRPFEGAACEMALMDIADLDGVIEAVATVLRPGGWFVTTLVHPCFPGGDSGLSSWPPDGGYSAEGFWQSADHNPDGVRIRLGSYHRTLATYVNTLVRHGLRIEGIAEAAEVVPRFLAIGCVRTRTE